MNGKDLMQALNDIDERYIEEALPWSAAVKKERHPVWALAAGLALCLGLGAGAALLFGGPLLTSGDPGPEVTTLENAATGEARAAEQEAPEVPIPHLEFAVNDTGIGQGTGGVYAEGVTQRELTLDELSSLREQPGLSWMGDYYLTGTALFDENGGTLQVMVAGYDPSIVDESLETFPVEKTPAFLLALGQEDLPTQIEEQLAFLEEPNNTVEGVGVRAAQFPYQGGYIDPVSGETTQVDSTLYCTGYTLDGTSVGLMAVGGDTLTEEEAQHLAEVAAGYGVYHGLSLEDISAEPKGKDTPNVNYGDSYHLTVLGPLDISQEESTSSQTESAVSSEIESQIDSSAVRQEPATSPTVDLSFTSRPEGDSTFSDVWNTFTELYLEPQDLAPHGAKLDYTLSEEEVASIWGGAVPWRDMLTENDEVLAYGYFSDEGELIKVFVGGYRDDPDTTNHEMFQLFAVSLYNMEPTGTWGQDVEEVLALAGATVNNMDVATQQIFSPVEYEDGSTMDHTAYSAAFQPAAGPAFMVVDAFASQVSFSEEEAKGFVEQVTGSSLYNGVNLDAIAKGE